MHILVSDETNQQPSKDAKFFIYGGLFIPVDSLPELDALVARARKESDYEPGDELKFGTHSRPDHVTVEQHIAAKNGVLEGCYDLGVRFSAYLVLHDIAKSRPLEEQVGWGVNTIMSAFNRFLEEKKDTGICVVDRLPFAGGYQKLRELFQTGITTEKVTMPLDRIHLFATTCGGASHASSVTDIVLGAFRYCVNRREPTTATDTMFPLVAHLMWYKKQGNTVYLGERGLIYRPKEVKYEPYKREYDRLDEHLRALLKGVPTPKPPA